MPVLCQVLQTKHSVEKINEEQKKEEKKCSENQQKMQREMLEWVATFEAKNGRKPTREDIENDSEGNRLFEVFRNAPGKA